MASDADDQEELENWVGSTVVAEDFVDADRCRRLKASLDLVSIDLTNGTPLPILWHWLYFLDATERRATGPDGHPKRGGFLPPVKLRRRMFAGGRTDIVTPIRFGMHIQRTSTVERVEPRTGSTGELVIVGVHHTISSGSDVLVEERQNIVYTSAAPSRSVLDRESPAVAVDPMPISRDVATDEVLLFRFSALTFNSHRIHYDRTYAQTREGYSDLVVHGPLTAMCLADAANASSNDALKWFEFRASAPIHVGEVIRLRGTRIDDIFRLDAYRHDGKLAVTASAGI